jgi:hypothetical protein
MMKEWIFVGPQIKKQLEDKDFSSKLHFAETRAWKKFEKVFRNFLCNEKAENYSEIV